jgi:hypothetical protein
MQVNTLGVFVRRVVNQMKDIDESLERDDELTLN